MTIDVEELRRCVVGQLQAQKTDPYPSAYGEGLIHGIEIALREIDDAIQRARSGGAS